MELNGTALDVFYPGDNLTRLVTQLILAAAMLQPKLENRMKYINRNCSNNTFTIGSISWILFVLSTLVLTCTRTTTVEIYQADNGTVIVSKKSLFDITEDKFKTGKAKCQEIPSKKEPLFQNMTKVRRKPRIVISRESANIYLTKTYKLENETEEILFPELSASECAVKEFIKAVK
ncbi:uncharacterized protein LOC124368338 [Homalodisca vitripennis]|uniref:uncharacterized protein LOC124368338 n=1 Tax=Homalodisca vitripennis TaxID=197043 RepID=UPI001EE9FB57|nr:uncharacterized protein LOC124368338 [Homalodisca vitripennis]